MARHPSPEELSDAACSPEHVGAGVQGHVAGCAACRAQVDEIRAVLGSVREAEVPEPPALYWQAFRRQVARRLEVEHAAARPRRGAAWMWLPALAAGAALALALGPRLGWRAPAPATLAPAAAFVPAWSPLPEAGDDTGLLVLQALASTDGLRAVAECRGLDECVASLPEEDARGLARAFRAELQGGEL